MHRLGSKFYMFASFKQQNAHTYLHDLQHFLPGNGSISVLVKKPKWPAQLLLRWALDEHADGHHILPEINHPILREHQLHSNSLSNLNTFHLDEQCEVLWSAAVTLLPCYSPACEISVLRTQLTPGRQFHCRNAFETHEESSVHSDILW